MLVNNAGVAHYMPLAELPADKAAELVQRQGARPHDAHPRRGAGNAGARRGHDHQRGRHDRLQRPRPALADAPPRGLRRRLGLPRRDVPDPQRGARRHRSRRAGGVPRRGGHRVPRAPGHGPQRRAPDERRTMSSPPACAAWNWARPSVPPASRTRASWRRSSMPTSPPSGGKAPNWPSATAPEPRHLVAAGCLASGVWHFQLLPLGRREPGGFGLVLACDGFRLFVSEQVGSELESRACSGTTRGSGERAGRRRVPSGRCQDGFPALPVRGRLVRRST